MSSHSRTAEREEERRLNLRTLVIASSASAAAALLTSQLWIAGTWIAAAMTPVIVALVSELLHRPTERIARSLTADRVALPAAGGAAPPPRRGADVLPERAPEEPGAGAQPPRPPMPGAGSEAPVRVYRSGGAGPHGTLPGDREAREAGAGAPRAGGPTRRRRIAYRAVFATAALAFVIAVAAITVPELLAGGSIGKNDGGTTLFGDSRKDRDRGQDEQAPQDTTEEEQAPQDRQQEEPPPTTDEETPPPEEEQTPTTEEPVPQEAPPGEPLQTTPAPPAQP
jgi:hypothetical protein